MVHVPRSKLAWVLALTVLAAASFAFAGRWEPFKYKTPAFFKYKVTQYDGDDASELVYALDIKDVSETTGEGAVSEYMVTTSVTRKMTEDELSSTSMLGMAPQLAMGAALIWGNPLFGTMISQMDLAVGEKMSFFGAGYAKVVKKETVAGVEGFVVEFYTKKGEGEEKSAEMTINADIALPLRSRAYSDGKLQYAMDLLEYHKN